MEETDQNRQRVHIRIEELTSQQGK